MSPGSMMDLGVNNRSEKKKHRQIVFNEAIVPMSAYMNTICLKRHLLASQRILVDLIHYLGLLLRYSQFDEDLLNFVLSQSYIVTAASCLSSVNFTLVCQSFLEHIRYILNKMEGDDDLVDENRKMIIQALSAEGFPNELEQQLLIKRSDLESALIGSCSTSGLIAFSGNVHLFWDSEI